MAKNRVKNKLVFNISCALLVLIVSFLVVYLLTGRNSYSIDNALTWDGVSVASSFSHGNGSEENPYVISNGEEFVYFKNLIEGANSDNYKDKYYVLGNDIDLGSHAISTFLKEFNGSFDGKGYTISNISIDKGFLEDKIAYYGIFAKVNNANIKNINIDNITISPVNEEVSYVVGSVFGVVKGNSTISNISVTNGKLDLDNTSDGSNNIGGLSGEVEEGVNLKDIYLNVEIVSSYTDGVSRVANKFLGSSSYIITNISLDNIDNYSTSSDKALNNYLYSEVTDDIIFEMNKEIDSSYYWENDGANLIIKRETEEVVEVPPIMKSFAFGGNNLNIVVHDSGISGDTVYINELEADLNYYNGLNYTDYRDSSSLPNGSNRNLYNDNTLVEVRTLYDGSDHINNDLVGYVSLDERQSKFVYYKYYPVVDGYVTFELIDNPYAARPNDKAFNGWVTDYLGAEVSLDTDIYVRTVKIPVTDTSSPISIAFHASWVEATTYSITSTASSEWTNAYSALKDVGMIEYGSPKAIYRVNEDLTDYFVYGGHLNIMDNYPSGAYDSSGNNVGGNRCNNYWNGCTYYFRAPSEYDDTLTYYYSWYGTMYEYTPDVEFVGYEASTDLPDGANVASLFRKVSLPRGESLVGYYNDTGVIQTSGKCNSSSCTYYEYIQYYDSDGNENIKEDNVKYYYLVTRDTNIVVLRANSNNNNITNTKPLTLTGINNGVSYTNNYSISLQSRYISARSDLRIEFVRLTTTRNGGEEEPASNNTGSSYIYGNWYNLKIGRGVTSTNNRYISAYGVIGGNNSSTGSSSSLTNYRLIIESGRYDTLSVATGQNNSTSLRPYISASSIYGSDYDKVTGNNDSLVVFYCASGSWGGYIYSSSNTKMLISSVIKSGSFGTGKYTYSTGVYVGGRGFGAQYAPREMVVEGGWIYNLIGGPSSNENMPDNNEIYINIKGGSVDLVFGGAGASATTGNRIINITGGVVNYAVFGGSNGYSGSDTGSYRGTLNGSTFIYVGGNAVIGDETLINNNSNLYGEEAGSVFGIGNGNSDSSKIGTAETSNIIIDGNAVIKRNVYGGGNYGAVGIDATGTTTTKINVLGGTINGSLYGGGNNNGSGSSSVTSTIDIKMSGGTINGSLYGGSRSKGVVYGNTNVNVLGGVIDTDVYGGGEGGYTNSSNPGTYVTQNVRVTVGNVNDGIVPLINGNVYGGSAYGTVNGSSSGTSISNYDTVVTVNEGTIISSVFGGGKGSSTFVPAVLGNVTVNINGGNIGNVFGGNDAAGAPNGKDVVYLNGGIIGNAFGGGNNTGQEQTNIYLQGAEVTNLFGGSNASGTVVGSNVTVTSGNVGNIYGGNNIGGNTETTNVDVISCNITGDIYGGGSKADTTETNVKIGETIVNNVYGGGEEADATNTYVLLNKTKAGLVFGGSNRHGVVDTTNVVVNGNEINSVYGGNNQGDSTGNTKVVINSGKIGNVYGGGDNAVATTSDVTINAGTITNVYGGGNQASLTTSNVLINNGTITNIYGGGNQAGVNTTNVNILGGSVENAFGGSNASGDVNKTNVVVGEEGSTKDLINVDISTSPVEATWQSSTYATYADVTVTLTNLTDQTISDWQIKLNMPEDAVFYSNWSNTDFTIESGVGLVDSKNRYDSNNPNKINANGTYSFTFAVLTNTSVSDFSVTSSVIKPASEIVKSNVTVGNLYGGNNQGGLTSDSNVLVNSGVIGNIYGGGNLAAVDQSKVIIKDGTIEKVFGGGNAAGVNGDTFVDIDKALITNNIYGGGNEGPVTGNTDVYLTDVEVRGSAYAGGNGQAAIVLGNSTITVDGKTIVGTETSVSPQAGCVFGGGNAAGNGGNNKLSVATVNIVGGIIYGNVYGGANTAIVNGSTITNIGTVAVNNNNLVESDLKISGTVFGGGEANASGSEIYDWTYIAVTKSIDVIINGNGYSDNNHQFVLNGSIFGSGNASTSAGTSSIYIKDLGTRGNPNKNISVQRTNLLVIDHSCIELSGIKDRTNEYSDIPYSFNRIDKLVVKNNTVLLLHKNANLLLEFYSGVDVDGTLVPATVTIDDEGNTVRNVDNRIYMLANNNLNVTTNANATEYGKVTGMTFLGMYTKPNDNYSFGLYGYDFENGSAADASNIVIGGSYVVGLHSVSHDITKDGFYSNFIDDEYTHVTVKYIDPTEIGETGYRWVIGSQAFNYEINLVAAKYSSLGTYELLLTESTDGNTTFSVVGFNVDGLTSGVNLVDTFEVPKIANSASEANRILGLSMKAETHEWTGHGTTRYLSANNGSYRGTLTYKTDTTSSAPSLMFYLYHAKNIGLTEDLGSVVISLQVSTPINEIESKVELVTVTVYLTASNFQDEAAYDASISYDKKYELPSATSVNITNQSQFSAYYSLFTFADNFSDVYGLNNDYYHSLVSSYVLPVGSQITMIDFGANPDGTPEYYYYTVDESEYTRAENELAQYNEASYPLKKFIKMGSTSADNLYDDQKMNRIYYDEDRGLIVEEFLFIFDLKETNTTGTHANNSMLFELRNSEDRSTITVLSIRQTFMYFSTYDSGNAVLTQEAGIDSNYMYYNIPYNISYAAAVGYDQTESRQSIINTNYESNSMGINVTIYDNSDNQISSSLLSGTNITIDGVKYFADSDGVYRIKLTNKVSNIKANMSINADELLPTGIYTLKLELFASSDGRHNSHALEAEVIEIPITVVGSDNSIVVTTDDKTKVVSGETGLNALGTNINTYNVLYNSVLTDPNARISIYKRNVDNKDTTEYSEVDFNTLFTNDLQTPAQSSLVAKTTYERMLHINANSNNQLDFVLQDNLVSGTYKLVFRLYDKNQLIEEDIKYVIVRKNVVGS